MCEYLVIGNSNSYVKSIAFAVHQSAAVRRNKKKSIAIENVSWKCSDYILFQWIGWFHLTFAKKNYFSTTHLCKNVCIKSYSHTSFFYNWRWEIYVKLASYFSKSSQKMAIFGPTIVFAIFASIFREIVFAKPFFAFREISRNVPL